MKVASTGGGRVSRWLMRPAPLGRIAALRTVAYLFVPVDVLLTTPWVVQHAQVPGSLYQPLLIGRLLHLPTPGGWVELLRWVLVGACLVAATGRLPRALGALIAVLYLEWMLVAFSYGKVDHDRVRFLVLLAVLPTVGTARRGDQARSEAAGWAVGMTTLAVVATYFLSAIAKLRFGGLDWVDGATLTRAVVRRGTALSTPLLDHTWVLHAFQYVLLGVELLVSPLLLVRWREHRITWCLVGGFFLFHLMTFLTISIVFLPHCVALLALLPLERFGVRRLVQHAPAREPVPA
ncbi:HTTM domain-containing protein [Nocardioides sp.]|uniref:HTTM domain-containing protein n=1 Tax=Nocardioides sp. TaxID=35761 RepID=UPI002602B150|nr:HTTM domain-containing protein [Nocardioides sp.]